MNIEALVEKLPSIVSSLYENILLINKDKDELYEIVYSGDKIKIKKNKPYSDLSKYVSNFEDDLVLYIENNAEFTKYLKTKDNKEKIITSRLLDDDYKLIFINDVTNLVMNNVDKKILIIADDSPIITKFFSKIFSVDYDVIVANNGDEAIKLVEQYKDLALVGVFLDLQMPVKSGFEVLDYFKEHDLFRTIPVSVISGEDTQEGIAKATTYNIVDMLQKPFTADAAKIIVEKTISLSPKNN